MSSVLTRIAKKEKFTLPPLVAEKISRESDGNLRKAILVFEALKMQSCVSFFSNFGMNLSAFPFVHR